VLRHCLPSETSPRRSATGRPARGQACQRWLGQLVSRGHLPKQGRVETVSEVTCRSRAGFRDVSERSGALDKSKLPSDSWFQRRTSSAFRSPEGSHKCEGQAALPIAAGAWEARRATGYV
jgi:hypothetical protein